MTEMVSVEVLNRFDRYDYYHIITFFPRVEVVVVLLHSLNIYQDQERVLCPVFAYQPTYRHQLINITTCRGAPPPPARMSRC